MSETRDLLAWLYGQIDADERAASAATPGPWRYDPRKCWRKPGALRAEEAVFAGPPGKDAVCVVVSGDVDDPQSMADAAHTALHDPAAVLADIAAKRALLDWLDGLERYLDRDDMSWHRLDGQIDVDHARKLLAAAYAGRPGYREEWRPITWSRGEPADPANGTKVDVAIERDGVVQRLVYVDGEWR